MSHHEDHHKHHHHHDHHHHDHHQEGHHHAHSQSRHEDQRSEASNMTLLEKATKLIDHWIKHNNDHIKTYKQWEETFNSHQIPEAAVCLAEVVLLTDQINKKLQSAASLIKEGKEED